LAFARYKNIARAQIIIIRVYFTSRLLPISPSARSRIRQPLFSHSLHDRFAASELRSFLANDSTSRSSAQRRSITWLAKCRNERVASRLDANCGFARSETACKTCRRCTRRVGGERARESSRVCKWRACAYTWTVHVLCSAGRDSRVHADRHGAPIGRSPGVGAGPLVHPLHFLCSRELASFAGEMPACECNAARPGSLAQGVAARVWSDAILFRDFQSIFLVTRNVIFTKCQSRH